METPFRNRHFIYIYIYTCARVRATYKFTGRDRPWLRHYVSNAFRVILLSLLSLSLLLLPLLYSRYNTGATTASERRKEWRGRKTFIYDIYDACIYIYIRTYVRATMYTKTILFRGRRRKEGKRVYIMTLLANETLPPFARPPPPYRVIRPRVFSFFISARAHARTRTHTTKRTQQERRPVVVSQFVSESIRRAHTHTQYTCIGTSVYIRPRFFRTYDLRDSND